MTFQSEQSFLRDQFNPSDSFAVRFYELRRRHRMNGWTKMMKAAAENYK